MLFSARCGRNRSGAVPKERCYFSSKHFFLGRQVKVPFDNFIIHWTLLLLVSRIGKGGA
jgi:hypothetical protein